MNTRQEERAHKLEIIFEFLVFGIVIGVIEDLIAVALVTGKSITWEMIGVIILVAIPFAIIGEVIADNINFAKYIQQYLQAK